MTIEEAARKLRSMYDHGSATKEASTYVHLFGIKYANELDGMPLADVCTRAGISVNYKTEISKGRKLAKFVIVKSS